MTQAISKVGALPLLWYLLRGLGLLAVCIREIRTSARKECLAAFFIGMMGRKTPEISLNTKRVLGAACNLYISKITREGEKRNTLFPIPSFLTQLPKERCNLHAALYTRYLTQP